ncbi:Der1-like family-domain-containing protein, partial [Dunaliella salina]
IWRLVTNFFFLGKLNFNFLIRMIWIIQHSCPLESQTFQFEPADYLWMLCVCGGLLIASTFITGFVINGVPLIMAIIYVWSRNFPEQQVSLYGLVKLQSFYLPWAFTGISMLMGQSIIPDLTGIAVGHAYYFLADVYPLQAGRHLIPTPAILKNWLADLGIRGIAPPPREVERAGAPQGFRSFQGRGRRLQD